MIAVKQDVISGVDVATVRTGSVVIGSHTKAGGVGSFECMSSDELEGGRLVQMGVSGKNSADKIGDGKARGFPEWGKMATGVSRWGSGPGTSPFFLQAF